MHELKSDTELLFRVSLLERAVADTRQKLDEMARLAAGADLKSDMGKSLLQTVVVDADSVAPFSAGFHAREFDATGRPYRWTGRGEFFEFRLRLDRRIDWDFEMDIRGNDNVNLERLRGFVDYVEVPLALGSESPVAGAILSRPFSNIAVLTFFLPEHFVPSRLDKSSPDSRTLGAVFYALKLNPRADAFSPLSDQGCPNE